MKKKSLLLIILLLVITLTIGASYALWQATHKQESKNVVSIGCFNLESDIGTSSEQAPISLMDAMPISDAHGMSLTPFTFTITNTCNMYAAYQVNLETLSATTLNLDYLKVALSNNTPAVLSSYLSVSPTITGANASNKLISGGLRQGESITYDLRLWLDESTPRVEGSNKIYNGKISIVAVPGVDDSAVATIRNLVKGPPSNSLDVITAAAPDGATCTNTLAYDNTADNNLRYVGSDPCNYVTFNNEVWRIIGLMNNIDDGTGKTETRLKIVRMNRIGSYSFDSSESNINNGYGINQWGPSTDYQSGEAYPGADLMQELNGDYLDLTLTENTMWYNGENNQKTAEFDYTTRLNLDAQGMIEDAVWYTGAANDTNKDLSTVYTNVSYSNERSNNPNSISHGKYCSSATYCNDTIERTYTWVGKVGLIYPSDFGYATSGSITDSTYTRLKCINEVYLYNSYYNNPDYGNCSATVWLTVSGNGWKMSPFAHASHSSTTDISSEYVTYAVNYRNFGVHPSLYLKSSVKITGGDGSSANPYTLG